MIRRFLRGSSGGLDNGKERSRTTLFVEGCTLEQSRVPLQPAYSSLCGVAFEPIIIIAAVE